MKKSLCFVLLLVFDTSVFAGKPTLIHKDGVLEIHADDLNYARDAISEQVTMRNKKVIKVFVGPMPQRSIRDVLFSENHVRLSLGKDLTAGFLSAERCLQDEMEKKAPKLAAKMKANPYDLRSRLHLVEKYMGLDKVNSKGLLLEERCWRVCWLEGIFNVHIEKSFRSLYKTFPKNRPFTYRECWIKGKGIFRCERWRGIVISLEFK